MADPQAEPFHNALASLRERLQAGAYPPGGRITAVDLADALRLSTTPVREALARLAGEGLVEDRRGQGYFVRQLSASDIGDLYRMSLACLLISQEPHRASRRPIETAARPPDGASSEPVTVVEALFRRWAAESGSRALVSTYRLLQIQLGPVRRFEARVLEDLAAEAERLMTATLAERLAQLRQFHGRRIRIADRLASLLDASASARK
jgi:DNA-binding transcriptional MocR family regulator